MKKYLIVVEKTDTGYSAFSPDVPGCGSVGDSKEEVERNIQEAIEFHKAIIESGGKVNLPAAARTETAPRGVAVTLTPERDIYVNQKKVPKDDLEETLRGVLSSGGEKIVILRGDRNVPLGEAVWVLSVIKKAGATEIAIAAQAETPKAPAQ